MVKERIFVIKEGNLKKYTHLYIVFTVLQSDLKFPENEKQEKVKR